MKIPRWLLQVIQLLLVIAVTYGIVRALAPEVGKISAQDFKQWRPDILLLSAATVMLLTVYLVHCFLWRVITFRLGGVKPGMKSTLRIYFLASLGRYIPGKLWQLAGLMMLAQKAGVPAAAASAALLAAQFAFLTSGLLYLALLLPGWGGNAPIFGALVMLAAGAGGFFVITATRLGHDIRAWLTRRFGQRFGDALMLLDRIQWKDAASWWVAYALSWALLGASFVVFVRAFAPVDPAQYLHVAGIVAAAYLFGYVAFFSFAGLGIREAVMLGLLNQVVPASAALVISVASRLWFIAAELLPIALIPMARDDNN